MNGEERQLITSLFDRMRNVGAVEKDRDADALISQSVRQIPDSAYLLVQSVLVQENALQQAGTRIEDLEDRIRQLEDEVARRAQPQQSSGGFLGGLFGGGAAPASRGSVPSVGSGRPMGSPSSGGSAWGNAPGMGRQQPAEQAWGGQPQQRFGGQQFGGQQQAPAGGGFMRSAMTTAAGVAGGMLVAGAISNMMKGDTAQAAGAPTAAADAGAGAADSNQHAGYSDADNDPGTQEVADDGNDPGWGGDDGGMDA